MKRTASLTIAAIVAGVLLATCASEALGAELQTCADPTADAGIPPPFVRLDAGTVLEQPSWVGNDARMCRAGQQLADCRAQVSTWEKDRDENPPPKPWVPWVVTGGALAAGLLGGLLLHDVIIPPKK